VSQSIGGDLGCGKLEEEEVPTASGWLSRASLALLVCVSFVLWLREASTSPGAEVANALGAREDRSSSISDCAARLSGDQC